MVGIKHAKVAPADDGSKEVNAAEWNAAHSKGNIDEVVNAFTLATLNALVSDATLDDSGASRTPTAHKASHEVAGGDLVDHDNLTNFVAAEHLSLPNTVVNVLSNHDTTTHVLGTTVPHDTLTGLTTKAHSELTGIGTDDHHRKWSWADESSWSKLFANPYPPFTKYGSNPVLNVGSAGQWDYHDAEVCSVLYFDGGLDGFKYWMYYHGTQTSDPYWRIGLARSNDGIAWTKHASNPILTQGTAGQWDDAGVGNCCIIKEGSNWYMWFSGRRGPGVATWRIGYATSSDGITWSKYAGNPIMTLGVGWESTDIGKPTVIKFGNRYLMWYYGYDGATYRLGFAHSTDRITWTKYSANPILSSGMHPSVGWSQGIFYVVFLRLVSGAYRLMYALGYLPWSLTEWIDNPIMALGSGWEANHHLNSALIMYEDTFKLWYAGLAADGSRRTGLATIP